MSQDNANKLQIKNDMTDEDKAAIALAMLDANLDEVADLPDFAKLPKGGYVFDIVACEVGMNKDKTLPAITVRAEVQETLELAKYPGIAGPDLPVEEVPAAGTLTSFNFTGAIGMQKFKKVFNDIGVAMGAGTIRQIAEMLGTGEVRGVIAVVNQRADKDKVDVAADGSTTPTMHSELVSVTQA